MKTKLAMSIILLNFSLASAQETPPVLKPGLGQFAVLKPNYSCEVNVPSGRSSSQVYFSEDCQTAYILPSLNMKKTVLKPYLTADSGICKRLEQMRESMSGISEKINKLELIIARLELQYEKATDKNEMDGIALKLDYFRKQKNSLSDQEKTALKPYYDTAAVRTQIRVESDVMDEVAAFQAVNLANTPSNVSKIYPVRFVPAQISSGILAISSVDAEGTLGRSVLKTNFPGTKYVVTKEEIDLYGKDATLINMNGSLSGIVDLSAVTYCSALDSIDQSVSTNERNLVEAFNAAVALNYDYQVKVQAGVRVHLKSVLETRDFLANVQNKIVNTAFERNEFIAAIIEGGVMDNLEIVLDDKGQQVKLSEIVFGSQSEDKEETSNIIGPLISKFIKTHLDKAENKLEQLGVLKKIDQARAKEIKAGTTTEVGGYRTICQSSSSWFGLSRSSSCRQEPIYVQVNHAGISELLERNVDNSKIESEVNIEAHETLLVRHTSTFGRN